VLNRLTILSRGFAAFAGVGALATTLHYAVLMVLVDLARLDPVGSSTAGAIVGASLSYCLNHRVTFRSERPHASAIGRFAVTALIGFCLNAGIMLITRLYPALHYLACQVIATVVVLFWNFFVSKYWTFSRPAHAHL